MKEDEPEIVEYAVFEVKLEDGTWAAFARTHRRDGEQWNGHALVDTRSHPLTRIRFETPGAEEDEEDDSMHGRLIVIEGLNGAGKSTQCRLLVDRLRAAGRGVVATGQPSTGPIGAFIRVSILGRPDHKVDAQTQALLFAADRRDHFAHLVQPALQEGKVVVCDRYFHTNRAFAGATLDPAWLAKIEAVVVPHLTVVLDVSVEAAQARMVGREDFAYDDLPSQERAERVYSHMYDSGYLVHVDGEGVQEEVAARVWEAARKVLEPR